MRGRYYDNNAMNDAYDTLTVRLAPHKMRFHLTTTHANGVYDMHIIITEDK